MEKESLHPSVEEFKKFVQSHPLLIKEVREGRKSWNHLYQDWVVLGSDAAEWSPYKKESDPQESTSGGQPDMISGLLKSLNGINMQDLQQNLSQFSGVMGNVQKLFQQFQRQPPQPPQRGPEDPFSFRWF
ncbi:spore coat protein YlbD [Bacillus sp. FJAT-44742]|uniref:spore coat protein YlbD n=1 Tax=Bacillus sp. FJAT-44742 TaxID=2014005 RepID=UPI000C2376C4|nr:spore coat protein YlbD [Bacillus sp. FJAT-44742]